MKMMSIEWCPKCGGYKPAKVCPAPVVDSNDYSKPCDCPGNMRDTDAWFVLNVGRIGADEDGCYYEDARHSRGSVLTFTSEKVDLRSARPELHLLLDKAINYISEAQEK